MKHTDMTLILGWQQARARPRSTEPAARELCAQLHATTWSAYAQHSKALARHHLCSRCIISACTTQSREPCGYAATPSNSSSIAMCAAMPPTQTHPQCSAAVSKRARCTRWSIAGEHSPWPGLAQGQYIPLDRSVESINVLTAWCCLLRLPLLPAWVCPASS
jgi:hypothetical protein